MRIHALETGSVHVKRAFLVAVATTGAALAAGGAGIALASSGSARTSAAPTPAPVLTAVAITRVPGTLHPGTLVSSSDLGHRVFVDSLHGFALASVGQAQYPAASTDGGHVWRVSGPALHLDAAQAPLSVCEVGAISQRVYFAYGCGETIDTTDDGGKHWWRTFLDGGSLAVVDDGGRLLALVESFGEAPTAVNWAYTSSDGGRHWHYEPRL
jgi:photosystem II stability/assembly factor-like uncharacterized protein